MSSKKKDPKAFDSNQRAMLRRRGLDPKDYELVKDTYVCMYIRDLRFGRIKLINKNN